MEPEESAEVRNRAYAWLTGGKTGLSSQTMCLYFLSGEIPKNVGDFPGVYAPADAGDLGRCLDLLEKVPEWRVRIDEMKEVSPQWAALVPIWGKLEELYGDGKPGARRNECYKVICEAWDRSREKSL